MWIWPPSATASMLQYARPPPPGVHPLVPALPTLFCHPHNKHTSHGVSDANAASQISRRSAPEAPSRSLRTRTCSHAHTQRGEHAPNVAQACMRAETFVQYPLTLIASRTNVGVECRRSRAYEASKCRHRPDVWRQNAHADVFC